MADMHMPMQVVNYYDEFKTISFDIYMYNLENDFDMKVTTYLRKGWQIVTSHTVPGDRNSSDKMVFIFGRSKSAAALYG